MRARDLKQPVDRGLVEAAVSRPLRARELKHDYAKPLQIYTKSRPLRARELKRGMTPQLAETVRRAPCGRVN